MSAGHEPHGRDDNHGIARGAPDGIVAFLFDLDGVLTQTAKVHAAAWKETFDDFLRGRSETTGEPFVPFDVASDYGPYVDGRLREDGVRSFLLSRGIDLPEGSPDDPPDKETVHGLATRKNDRVLALIEERGVEVYDGSVRLLRKAREAGIRCAVVTASKNGKAVLEAAGIANEFELRVDGEVAAREGLRGKPEPDTFLAAAKHLGIEPMACAVFEDALAGVAAGHAGGFGWVVGVNRIGGNHADALRNHGADIVVGDLSELLEDA